MQFHIHCLERIQRQNGKKWDTFQHWDLVLSEGYLQRLGDLSPTHTKHQCSSWLDDMKCSHPQHIKPIKGIVLHFPVGASLVVAAAPILLILKTWRAKGPADRKTPRFMQGSNLKPLPYQTCAQSFISPVKQWCSAQPFCSLLQHHCFFESDHPGTVAPVEHRRFHEIFCWKAPWSQLEKPAWQSLGQAVLLRFALDSKQKMKQNLTCGEERENAKPAVMKRIMVVMMKMIMTTIVIMTTKMIIIIRNS